MQGRRRLNICTAWRRRAQRSTACHGARKPAQQQSVVQKWQRCFGQLPLCAAGTDIFPAALPCVQKKKRKKKDA